MIWFHKTVYPWRVAASCIWLWSLTLTLLLFYHLLMFSSVLKVESLLCMFIFIASVLLIHISQLWLLDAGKILPVQNKSTIINQTLNKAVIKGHGSLHVHLHCHQHAFIIVGRYTIAMVTVCEWHHDAFCLAFEFKITPPVPNREFPLVASFSEDSSRTLILGLESNNLLIKYLAFMDLARLSVQSPSRRSKVYSLSTSGGPGVWINIYHNCISQLNNLITSLGGRGGDVTNGFTPSLPTSSTVTYRKGWGNELTTPTLSRSHVYAERAVLTGHVQELHHKATPTSHAPTKSPRDQVKDAVSTLSSFKREIVKYLKKKPQISYFLTELPEQKEKELLSESLLYICIVTSLTHLAVHSRTEDKYGVVQINLPQIVKKFIELLTLLQKHVRQRFGATYTNESVNQLENGKYGLRNAVEEGLHLIGLTFPDTRFMNLTSEEKWKLNSVTGQAS